MRTVRLHQWLMGAVVACAGLAVSGGAFAAGGGVKEEKGKATPTPKTGGSAELGQGEEIGINQTERTKTGKKEEATKEEKEEENNLFANVDFVLGFGKTTVVNTGAASQGTTGSGLNSTPSIGTSRFTSYSFLASVGFEVVKGLEVELRLPVAGAKLSGDGDSRGVAALGNVELEGGYAVKLDEKLRLILSVGVAAPTAQGTEIPDSADRIPVIGSGIDQAAYDRFATHHAAQMARGFEENASFAPSRLGIVPKVRLAYHADELHIDPWVKLENLIATDSALANKYVGELVMGVNLGYEATTHLEPTLRVWTNIPLANADFKAVGVAEPQLRMRFGEFTPALGIVLPFAGTSLTDPYTVGVRATAGLRF